MYHSRVYLGLAVDIWQCWCFLQYARRTSCFSLGLGLAVKKEYNVYRTVRKKAFVFLARVRVSSQ